jgi:N utilization substance protein A
MAMKTEFLTAITQLSSEKGVPREIVMKAIEAALISAYKREFETPAQDFYVEFDEVTNQPHIFHRRLVVEAIEEERADERPVEDQITLTDAREAHSAAELGEVIIDDVTPPDFGKRIQAQTAKQVIQQKLREAEKRMVFDEFADREGEIIHGTIQRIEAGTAIVELGRAEAIMPRSEQVPTERYYPGQRLKVYVSEVQDTHRGPHIVVSRAHRLMLRRLFEQEVPEIFNGTVEIKAIAREAGARAKVAVTARQTGIDPVGSCVGPRGVRIQNIVNELGGEKIDVVEWADDAARYVANALSPAQVVRVAVDEDSKTATVIVPERQLSLAIGKEGQNARLAAKLTGWRIDIKSDSTAQPRPPKPSRAELAAAARRERQEQEGDEMESFAAVLAAAEASGLQPDKDG